MGLFLGVCHLFTPQRVDPVDCWQTAPVQFPPPPKSKVHVSDDDLKNRYLFLLELVSKLGVYFKVLQLESSRGKSKSLDDEEISLLARCAL